MRGLQTPVRAIRRQVFTEVPPWITPTLNVVFGSFGTWNSAICAIARPIAWIGLGMPKFWKL